MVPVDIGRILTRVLHNFAQGFWQERLLRLQQKQQLGPAVLLFGCRSSKKDLLYKDALDSMVASGSISKVVYALSREPGVRKAYVQVGRGWDAGAWGVLL